MDFMSIIISSLILFVSLSTLLIIVAFISYKLARPKVQQLKPATVTIRPAEQLYKFYQEQNYSKLDNMGIVHTSMIQDQVDKIQKPYKSSYPNIPTIRYEKVNSVNLRPIYSKFTVVNGSF